MCQVPTSRNENQEDWGQKSRFNKNQNFHYICSTTAKIKFSIVQSKKKKKKIAAFYRRK